MPRHRVTAVSGRRRRSWLSDVRPGAGSSGIRLLLAGWHGRIVPSNWIVTPN